MSVLRMKSLLLLACWSVRVVEGNFLTNYFFAPVENQDLENPEVVKEELIELEELFGSLRFAFAFRGARCNDEDFKPEFWDALTHAAASAIGAEMEAGGPSDRLLINPKFYKNILHKDVKAVNGGGLIWQHFQGHARTAPPPAQQKDKKDNKDGGRRRQLLAHGDPGAPLDNFCEDVRRSLPSTRYVECACTGGWCTPPERRLRGNGNDEMEQEEVEAFYDEEEDVTAGEESGHRELGVDRVQFMQIFRDRYPIPAVEFSPTAEEGAARYLRIMMSDETDKSVFPECFDRTVEPIVFAAMILSA